MNTNNHEINQTNGTLSYNAKEFTPQKNLSVEDVDTHQTEDFVQQYEDVVSNEVYGEQGYRGYELYPMNSYDPYNSWGHGPMIDNSSRNYYQPAMNYPLPYDYYPYQPPYPTQRDQRPSYPIPISSGGHRAVEYKGCVYYEQPSHVYEQRQQIKPKLDDDDAKKTDDSHKPGYEYDSDNDSDDFDYLMMIDNHPIYNRSDL